MELKNQTQIVRFDREITGQTREQILPTVIQQAFSSASTPTTIRVSNLRVIYCDNSSAIEVSNFTGGAELQTIALRGDGFTTVKNNSNIVTNTGADKVLSLNKVYRFTLFDNSGTLQWLEDE